LIGAKRNQVAAGVGARQADGARRRIGSVLAEFDHLRPVDKVKKLLGALGFEVGGPVKLEPRERPSRTAAITAG
jgi:hypothetical protein